MTALLLLLLSSASAVDQYIEAFDTPGNPGQPFPLSPDYWTLSNGEDPGQDWSTVAPGDGYAYLTVHASDVDNDGGSQALGFGVVGPGQSINVRLKGGVIPGYVGHIFTYAEDTVRETTDEIAIELFADDTSGSAGEHAYIDWTDARFNAFDNADDTGFPDLGNLNTPIVDALGAAQSHYDDDTFHTYTIDWYDTHVDFYIDGVLQHQIVGAPDATSELFVGFRDLPSAGLNDAIPPHVPWTGSHTMVIDYVRIGANGDIDPQQGFVPPAPVLRANGQSGSVTLPRTDIIRMTLDIDASVFVGYPSDLWIRATGPGPIPYWWQPGTGWVRSDRPHRAGGGPLRNLNLELMRQRLPVGTYVIEAAIDDVGGGNDRSWSNTLQLEVL